MSRFGRSRPVDSRCRRAWPVPLAVAVRLDVRNGQCDGDDGQRGHRLWSVSLALLVSSVVAKVGRWDKGLVLR
jgi:hypothetical protein